MENPYPLYKKIVIIIIIITIYLMFCNAITLCDVNICTKYKSEGMYSIFKISSDVRCEWYLLILVIVIALSVATFTPHLYILFLFFI